VLQLAYSEQKIILAGDATHITENAIMANFQERFGSLEALKSNILKVGHHGSARGCNSPKWAQAVNPEWLFISADRGGSLSDDESTGHRLPQEFCIDIYRANAARLQKDIEAHYYVSSFQKKDYPLASGKTGVDGWINPTTSEAIFTTVAIMDAPIGSGQTADIGQQFQLVIHENGATNLTTTHE
jgi:hypothetical protein